MTDAGQKRASYITINHNAGGDFGMEKCLGSVRKWLEFSVREREMLENDVDDADRIGAEAASNC